MGEWFCLFRFIRVKRMNIEGTIEIIAQPVSGSSARGSWTKQDMILMMPGEFNKKLCVTFWGDKVQELAPFKVGDKVLASVNIESREYNGRWFTEVRAWRLAHQEPAPMAAAPMGASYPIPDEIDDDMVF